MGRQRHRRRGGTQRQATKQCFRNGKYKFTIQDSKTDWSTPENFSMLKEAMLNARLLSNLWRPYYEVAPL
eukprot:4640902-Ditylum_brightwellii.AAC.1